MAEDYGFAQDEMAVNENLGYPKAYAKLCRDQNFSPYSHGPPFTFTPYALHEHEDERASVLDQMFPLIDPKAKPTTKPKIFVGILWKQLNHLGNAGFDPAVIRVDGYGNVLYYHADSASPLAWDIDHWFPCSRGGLTVLSNLRILQRQACKRKKNKLEFLVPWWDFQLGISVNQFLSIFASSNSDFRHRGFSFLFSEGENHELNASQIVDSHSFPQHFIGLKQEVGLAPAAIVESRRDPYDALALRQLDHNRRQRPMSPAIAARRSNGNLLKENEDPGFAKNPYQAIVMARDSLKQREETSKMQAEMQKLDHEVYEMKLKNEEEKLTIQDLELALIKRRRKAEKCRRLAEAQSSYRTMLEKMIRDTMHQSVIYKEQVRLNQAAANALMARLEAQREICDNAEKDLHKKYRQRDDIEKQIRPEWEQGRKRSRIDYSTCEERDSKPVLYLPSIRPRTSLHKELRVFLEEEQKASEVGLSSENEEQRLEELKIPANNDNDTEEKLEELKMSTNNDYTEEKLDEEQHTRAHVALDEESSIEHRLQKLEINESKRHYGTSFADLHESKTEEDEETRKQRGKGNIEKWLEMLLENSKKDEMDPQEANENASSRTEEIIQKLNQKFPQQELKISKVSDSDYKEKQLHLPQDKNSWEENEGRVENEAISVMPARYKNYSEEACTGEGNGPNSFEGLERKEQHKKGKSLVRSESARTLRRIPSSPSLLLGMRKGVDRIRKILQ
ncbi:nuclear matrix constituent protein 1 isoform X2 [Lotus japonicus]|uniref:nuclear matrix constituent protein 1 isoform X2 n=1 Tax=Lotus japonicus TaxID=34305 RepID=UPI002589C907|nr:nuclear matrix constituent protein 1 isoform X2 [Lotus japonicus]